MLFLVAALLIPLQGRLAISHDGNYHDQDDVGAVAMMEALLWRAGEQTALVHLDYNNHRGASTVSWEDAMRTSAVRFTGQYGLDRSVVFDVAEGVRRAVDHLAQAISASSATDRLTLLQAGPWQTTALAFLRADPTKHQYVTIVSHSDWNDDHEHFANHRNRLDFFALYNGPLSAFMPPAYMRIDDQNDYAFKSSLSSWSWMQGAGPQLSFVFSRTAASGNAQGDMSDAGMLFYLLTGIEHPTMGDVRAFFGL